MSLQMKGILKTAIWLLPANDIYLAVGTVLGMCVV